MTKRKASANGAIDLDADFVVEMWPIERPIPYKADPKVHTPESEAKLAEIIRRVGVLVPLVCTDDGQLYKGRRCLAALKLLGATRVPVKIARGISLPELKAWRLADNRSTTDDGWDEGALGIQLQELRAEGVPLSHTAFEDEELTRLLGDGQEDLKPHMVRELPSMTWVLIGIPTVRYHAIAELVTSAQLLEEVVCEVTANDKTGRKP